MIKDVTSVNLNREVFFQVSDEMNSVVKPMMENVYVGQFATASPRNVEFDPPVKPMYGNGATSV